MTTQLCANCGRRPLPPAAVDTPSTGGSVSDGDGGKNALREHPKQVRTMGVASTNDVIQHRAIEQMGVRPANLSAAEIFIAHSIDARWDRGRRTSLSMA